MDAFSDPRTEQVVLCFCAQAGKTEVLMNFLGYVVDQDPGPVLIVYPREADADKTIRNRVHPMFSASPALRQHCTGNPDDLGLKELHFDSTTFYTAWSNSPAALASTPIRYVIFDEVDKFPPFAGKEASPIKLGQIRTRTYRGRSKVGEVSTPTLEHGEIWQAFQKSNKHYYHVPCPFCGHFQVLDFAAGIKWQKGASATDIAEQGLAWYECSKCKGEIQDHHKAEFLTKGKWVAEGESRRIVGYHISALYSPWSTFGDCAAEFLESYQDRALLMNFRNSWLALPWREKVESLSEERIKSRRKPYGIGTVPDDAVLLTAGVDVQEDHFFYSVRAWGAGEKSWLIRYGVATSWSDVEKVISAPYEKQRAGLTMHVRRAMVDSGFKTEEVYRFCRNHRPACWPSKGSGNIAMASSVRTSKPEAGTLLFTFKVDYWKDKLSRAVCIATDAPGEWCLPEDVDAEYVRQMVSERRVIEKKAGRLISHWEPVSDHAPNHYWDCEVLNILAADIEGVRYVTTSGQGTAAGTREPKKPKGGGWLQREQLLEQGESFW